MGTKLIPAQADTYGSVVELTSKVPGNAAELTLPRCAVIVGDQLAEQLGIVRGCVVRLVRMDGRWTPTHCPATEPRLHQRLAAPGRGLADRPTFRSRSSRWAHLTTPLRAQLLQHFLGLGVLRVYL